jgi:hypothetical protein
MVILRADLTQRSIRVRTRLVIVFSGLRRSVVLRHRQYGRTMKKLTRKSGILRGCRPTPSKGGDPGALSGSRAYQHVWLATGALRAAGLIRRLRRL